MSGRTPRDLTLDDALALRRIRGVTSVAPLNIVSGEVWWRGRRRDAPVAGSTSELSDIWGLAIGRGRFLPQQDPRHATPVCVLGTRVERELFGAESPLGEWIRIGNRRFRVVGVLAPKGEFVGLNMDDLVIIPVASAQVLFNLPSLLRIGVTVPRREESSRVRDEIRRTLRARHNGEEDVTILTEDSVASAFDRILLALTFALGGIATISLAVAGILIMNVMLIAVSQRTGEIGLLKAIGASPGQIRFLFFAEAAVLSVFGAIVGSVLGQIGSLVIRQVYPAVPAAGIQAPDASGRPSSHTTRRLFAENTRSRRDRTTAPAICHQHWRELSSGLPRRVARGCHFETRRRRGRRRRDALLVGAADRFWRYP